MIVPSQKSGGNSVGRYSEEMWGEKETGALCSKFGFI